MKQSTLTLTIICALCAVSALSYAGTERYSGKDKEVMQQAPAPCEWYRAHEWNIDVWGTVAFPVNTGRDNHVGSDFDGDPEPNDGEFLGQRDIGEVSNDRFINRDNAWGGGADIKYFVSKYWGFGATGFVLDANDNIGGAGLLTFNVRYPIGCSRFAPYAWAGIGALSGGSHTVRVFNDLHDSTADDPDVQEENEIEFRTDETRYNHHTLAIGQFGGGLEIRVTRHVGFMADVAYNAVQESNNDFWMTRFGLTLSY